MFLQRGAAANETGEAGNDMSEAGAPASKPPRSRARWLRLRSGSAVNILVVFIVIQALCSLGGLLFPDQFPYLSAANIRVQLQAIPDLGIVSLGVGVLMIAGEFDLSVGANYTFSAIVMATLVTIQGTPVILAVLVALAIGTIFGLLNALVTFGVRIPSFIATLGSGLFLSGFTLFYHGATFLSFTPDPTFTAITTGSIGPIQAEFLWFVVITLLVWLLLHRHALGNQIFAVGDDAKAANEVGVRTRGIKTLAFAIAGFCAAVAGIISTTRVSSIVPGQGDSLTLDAIAACVIGGIALSGGRGTALGIFLGASLIYTIQDVLLLVGAPGFYLQLFVGLLIIAAAGFNQLASKRKG